MLSADVFDSIWDNLHHQPDSGDAPNPIQHFKSAEHGLIAFRDKAAYSTDRAKASDIEIIEGPKTWDIKRAIANDINAHLGN